MSIAPETPPPLRRADHVRNRAMLIAAAREVFAEQGADAPIEEVVRRAGFAKGTFFRHFATKETLVQALLADHLTALGDIAQEINRTQQPGWATLGLMLERCLERVAGDLSLADFLERGQHLVFTPEIAAARQTLDDQIGRAVTGAQAAGEVRSDLAGTDIPPIMLTVARATARYHATHPGLGRRYLRLFLDGIRAGQTTDLGDPPLTVGELDPSSCSR